MKCNGKNMRSAGFQRTSLSNRKIVYYRRHISYNSCRNRHCPLVVKSVIVAKNYVSYLCYVVKFIHV